MMGLPPNIQEVSLLPPKTLAFGPGLQLERVEPGDGQKLFNLVDQNHDFIAKALPAIVKGIRSETAEYYCEDSHDDMRRGKKLDYFVAHDGEPVGRVKLGGTSSTMDDSEAVMTYWLAEAASGQGIMTLAARRIIDYGFEERNMRAACLDIAHSNKPSQRVAERLGAVIIPPTYDYERSYDVWKVFPYAG